MDMRTVLEKTRYLHEIESREANKKLADSNVGKKAKLKKDQVLTDEDIERSLSAIKSGLATLSDGKDSIQERYEQIGEELKKAGLPDEEYKEEFKDLFQKEDGTKIVDKDEDFERQMNEVSQKVSEMAEPD